MAKERAKFGYLLYDDMLQKISEGTLDQHDVVFTKDTKETFIIDSEGSPIALRSKVYVYDSMTDAIRELNRNTDTYVGQVVSILEGDTYRGYIVNQNTKQRTTYYTVSPLTDTSSIDYNTLGNKPIVNMVGVPDNPLIISHLENGIYSVKGHFKIADNDVTTHLNPNAVIFIVEHDNESIHIKQVSTKEIIDYVVSSDLSVILNQYVTEDFLKEKGYVTSIYVDEKIVALDFITREEASKYIESLIETMMETKIVPIIDERIDKKIIGVTNEQIISLFEN